MTFPLTPVDPTIPDSAFQLPQDHYAVVKSNEMLNLSDGPDADAYPDLATLTGTIVFQPSIKVLNFVGSDHDEAGSITMGKITATVGADGKIYTQLADGMVVKGVYLISNSLECTNRTPWNYKVSFYLRANGVSIVRNSFLISVDAGQVYELARLEPAVASDSTLIVQGPRGEQGIPGADSTVPGPMGLTGATGPAGPAGADSTVPGPIGLTGPAGADSTVPGPQGPAGADSTVPGPQGIPGIQGLTGLTGATGPAGRDGIDGVNGVDGRDGAGVDIIGNVPTVDETSPETIAASFPANPEEGDAYQSTDLGRLWRFNGVVWVDSGQFRGEKGDKGDKGDTGAPGVNGLDSTVPGPQGIQGIQGLTGADSTVPGPAGPVGPAGADSVVPGPTGATGPAPVLTVGVTGASEFDEPDVFVQEIEGGYDLNFWMPRGATGMQGPAGQPGIQGVAGPQGVQGVTGPANTLAIGTVATGAAGSAATASITGAAPNQTLGMSIPRGATGATGPAPVMTAGTATALPAGSAPTVSVTGSGPYAVNFGIPAGATGASGSGAEVFEIGSTTAAPVADSGTNYLTATTTLTVNKQMTLSGISFRAVGADTYKLSINNVDVTGATVTAAAGTEAKFSGLSLSMAPGTHTVKVTPTTSSKKVRYSTVASISYVNDFVDFSAAGWVEAPSGGGGTYTLPLKYEVVYPETLGRLDDVADTIPAEDDALVFTGGMWRPKKPGAAVKPIIASLTRNAELPETFTSEDDGANTLLSVNLHPQATGGGGGSEQTTGWWTFSLYSPAGDDIYNVRRTGNIVEWVLTASINRWTSHSVDTISCMPGITPSGVLNAHSFVAAQIDQIDLYDASVAMPEKNYGVVIGASESGPGAGLDSMNIKRVNRQFVPGSSDFVSEQFSATCFYLTNDEFPPEGFFPIALAQPGIGVPAGPPPGP